MWSRWIDFNPCRKENKSFLGPKLIIDAGKPVTVVTKFFAKDRTDNSRLS
jgi:hypothetical protein